MAIDTISVTDLITEFRALQAKDSVSPENLGYILQRITDLLATAGTSETIAQIQKLLDGFKAAGQALTSITQGQSDRNNIYANKSMVNLSSGEVSSASGIFIQQATTERAGAMRAQQVIDLNAAKKAISALETAVESLKNSASTSTIQSFSLTEEDGHIKLYDYGKLVSAGYVPYLFRLTKKRNRFDYNRVSESSQRYCSVRKGWNLYGSRHAVKILSDNTLAVCTDKKEMTIQKMSFSNAASNFVYQYTNANGVPCVGWGKSIIRLVDNKNTQKHRMLKLRFAVAFGPKIDPTAWRITPSEMVTPLMEFSLVYDTTTQSWFFGK